MSQNKDKVAAYLQASYGVSAADIENHRVRLRILFGTTVFGNRGHTPTAAEQYGLQLEKKNTTGQYVPATPEMSAYVGWRRDQNGNVNGFTLQLVQNADLSGSTLEQRWR